MKKIDTSVASEALATRVLDFLNAAKNARAITTSARLKDDPDRGIGRYRIGMTVAKRIVQRRDSLPGGKFNSLDQLSDIDGFGADKFHDLLFSFRLTAADEFVASMYAHVIDSRWQLSHLSRNLDTEAEYQRLTADREGLWRYIVSWLNEIQQREAKSATGLDVPDVSRFDQVADAKESEFEWTLWLYRMGDERFFSFDSVREQVEKYLRGGETGRRVSWCLLRDYQDEQVMPSSTYDLPITLNASERCISLWQMERQ